MYIETKQKAMLSKAEYAVLTSAYKLIEEIRDKSDDDLYDLADDAWGAIGPLLEEFVEVM